MRFSKFKILGFFCTFWPISKQTADFSKKGFYTDDRLLMLYVLASIVFLYHQWLRWDFEMLEKTVPHGGVCGVVGYHICFKGGRSLVRIQVTVNYYFFNKKSCIVPQKGFFCEFFKSKSIFGLIYCF